MVKHTLWSIDPATRPHAIHHSPATRTKAELRVEAGRGRGGGCNVTLQGGRRGFERTFDG